ncbi:MAG: CPBP family intramembrane metalloprotease [Chitinophagaceae bacterium]|nr:CPBP family intramembrane metalloprotease [Chitinophagaceae bacterium]MCW5929270.1 CPBP family intramembrane metalloprotease [Chitinophagaceae bacterium]
MYNTDSKGISYSSGFFILIGLWVGGLILGVILTIPLWAIFGHGSLMSIEQTLLNPENLNASRLIQFVTTACLFFLPAYFTAYIINKRPLKFLGLHTTFNYRQLFLSAALIFLGAVFAAGTTEIMERIPLSESWEARWKGMEENYIKQVEAIAPMNTVGQYLFALVMVAVLPAVFEEFFFRGGMQNLLTRSTKNIWFSIIATSIVFSLVHFSFYGFLARVCLGIVLGLIYYYSKSLWLCIIAHGLNNAFAVTQIYLLVREGKSVGEAMNEKSPVWWSLAAAVGLIFLFILFKKVCAAHLAKHTPPEEKALDEKWIA